MKSLAVTAALLAGGCAGEPFSRPPIPDLRNARPQAVRDNFASRLPDATRATQKSTLHFPFMDMTILNHVDAERPKNQFAVQGYMALGMIVYDISGNADSIRINASVPQFDDYRYILESIGHDLRHVYLDLTPGPGARSVVSQKEVFFSQKTAEGTLCFEFAYDPPVLIEKRLSGLFGTVWRIRYYDYRTGADGKVRPYGIVVDNSRYMYRIVLYGEDVNKGRPIRPDELLTEEELAGLMETQ